MPTEITPHEHRPDRMERFRSLQAGQYWRAKEAIPDEGIAEGLVLLIQSIRWVDGDMHTVVLRPHPTLIGKSYDRVTEVGGKPRTQILAYDEHRFLIGDFETLFTYEPDARKVRDAELRGVQDRVYELQRELVHAQSDPSVMEGVVEDALRADAAKADAATPRLTDGSAPPEVPAGPPATAADRVDVVALSTGSMVDSVGPGLTEEGVERMRAAAGREHRIATIRAGWIQGRTTAIADTIKAMTPFYEEQAAAALAMTEEVRDHVAKLLKGIETLDLYVGKGVHVTTIREGESAPPDVPLTFVQRKLLMDEELAVYADVDARFDHSDADMFFEAIRAHDGLVRQVFPTERCVLVMASTRRDIDYANAYESAIRNAENRKVFLLVRDGMNVHRVFSPVESHLGTARLFPSQSQQDSIFRGIDGSKVRFEDVAFTDHLRRHDSFALHYKRFLILACGLDHRLDLFGRFYDGPKTMGFVSQAFQDECCRFLHDDDMGRMLPGPERPDVMEWMAAMNAYLRSGSRVLCKWSELLNPDTAPSACKERDGTREEFFDRPYTPARDMEVRVAFRSGDSDCVDVEVSGYVRRTGNEKSFKAKVDLGALAGSRWGHEDVAFLCLDAVDASDLEFYIHNRGERRDHLSYIRFFKAALAHVRAEEAGEADARARMLRALEDGRVGTPEARPSLVRRAVVAWRAANRGAPLPSFEEGAGTPWREVLDQMFVLAEEGGRDEGVEAFVRGLGHEPLRLVMTGKGRLAAYAAPAGAERDDRLEPHAWAHLIQLAPRAGGYVERGRRWAVLPDRAASETTLHEWPGAAAWRGRPAGFATPAAKSRALDVTSTFASDLRGLAGPVDEAAFSLLVSSWKAARARANKGQGIVMSPEILVPFGALRRSECVQYLCVSATAHAVLARIAPSAGARAAFREVYASAFENRSAGYEWFDRAAAGDARWRLCLANAFPETGRHGVFAHHTFGTETHELSEGVSYDPLLSAWFARWRARYDKAQVWLAEGAADADGVLTLDGILGIARPEGYEPTLVERVSLHARKGRSIRLSDFLDLSRIEPDAGRRRLDVGARVEGLVDPDDFGCSTNTHTFATREEARDYVRARAVDGGRVVRAEDVVDAPPPPEGIERWFLLPRAT